MPDDIEKLEEDLKEARKRKASEAFMAMVKAARARKTSYKCKKCGMDFYIGGTQGYCLCDNSPWRTDRKACFVCGNPVSTVFEDIKTGYDYHPAKNQEFIILDYEQWEDHYSWVYLCEICAKLPYIKLVKNRLSLKLELHDKWDELNSLEREKGNLLRRVEDIDMKVCNLNDDIALLDSDSKKLEREITGERFKFETKN